MSRFTPLLDAISAEQRRELPPFRVGDTVRVHYRIREGDKERVQVFQGTVIRKSGGAIGKTFCVRKRSGGVGVERVFPYHSPRIENLEVVSSGRVRRSRLFYLRDLQGKKARLKKIRGDRNEGVESLEDTHVTPENVAPPLPDPEPAEAESPAES